MADDWWDEDIEETGEHAHGPGDTGEQWTDPRTWGIERRRTTSLGVLGIAALFVVGSLAVFFLNPSFASTLLIVFLVGIVLAGGLEAAVIITDDEGGAAAAPVAQDEAWEHGGDAGWTAAEPEAEHVHDMDVECPSCQQVFTVEDPGDRPLNIQCPYCGVEGSIEDPPAWLDEHDHGDHDHEDHGATGAAAGGVDTWPEDGEEGAADDVTEMTLRCSGCSEEFSIEDTGERPLQLECPNCHKRGVLRS